MTSMDKYGITKLHESVGLEWFNTWDNGKSRSIGKTVEQDPYDPRLKVTSGSPDTNVNIIGDGTVQMKSSATVSSIRLWVEGPWTNTEMTTFVKRKSKMTDVQMRSRSNHLQTGATYQCVFGDYVVAWRSDKKITMAVEPMHPIYKKYIVTKQFAGFPQDVYLGYKQVTRTVGGNKVLIEGYRNSNGDKKTWNKEIEYTFDGKNVQFSLTAQEEQYRKSCIDKGDKVANDLQAATLRLDAGARCWLRMDECTGWNMKWYSVREIDPL